MTENNSVIEQANANITQENRVHIPSQMEKMEHLRGHLQGCLECHFLYTSNGKHSISVLPSMESVVQNSC